MSYCEERLKALHITDELNSWKATDQDGHSRDFKFFTPLTKLNKDGVARDDISINYIAPDGVVEQYETENRKIRDFSRTRLKNPEEGKGKYQQPPKTGTIPFSTPEILKAFAKGEKVKTLYIVEGEFKAFALSNFGLPCFGIGGIQNFRNKSKNDIHPYILGFCDKCKVENINLIFDADCLKVEWKEDKELTTRLSGFYSAVNNFNELLKPHNINLYFSHVVKESEQKGIDDVLYSGFCDPKLVIEETTKLMDGYNERKYVLTYQISGMSSFKIQRIFGLDSVKSFFTNNENELKDHEFVYHGNTYYIDENGQLAVSWKGEQNNYIRVGVDYYKKVVSEAPDGQTEIDLVKWSMKNIKDDFFNPKEFLKRVLKCDAFTNIPENDPTKFKQIIESTKNGINSKLYNRYCPVYHVPQEGNWNLINRLLHHIFDYKNCAGDSLYEFALDYIQLLYTQPTQHLPILCLVSRERKTGKTTFLQLLRDIFLENMRILDSQRLMSNFNGHWAGKLIVSVDESFINMDDKNGAGNKLKMIATNSTIPLEAKAKDATETPNFSKLILCSNDEYNFVKIDNEENRYCIIKVNPFSGTEDPEMGAKMREEIPAFLYYLKNRKLYHEKRSRLWFDDSLFETPALLMIKERTDSMLAKNIKDVIRDQFFWQETDTVQLSLPVLTAFVKEQYKFAEKMRIAEYMRDQDCKLGNSTAFFYKNYVDDPVGETKKDRCYTFKIDDYLTKEEIADILKR